jgi:hypothetical protein
MKDRILYGWTFQRGFYLLAGLAMGIISILNHEWIGVAVGAYFASMGLFAFGCAGGQCYTGKFPSPVDRDSKTG